MELYNARLRRFHITTKLILELWEERPKFILIAYVMSYWYVGF